MFLFQCTVCCSELFSIEITDDTGSFTSNHSVTPDVDGTGTHMTATVRSAGLDKDKEYGLKATAGGLECLSSSFSM